jgi:hypothetical protein
MLLVGEIYLGDKPATPWTLLVELLEVALLVGFATACTLVIQRGRTHAAEERPWEE